MNRRHVGMFAVLNLLSSFIRQNAAFCRNKSTSTIYALSSGAVRSALATIRVSGPNTASVLRRMAQIKHAAPRRALLRRLIHPRSGVHLDTAIVIWFPSPRSYTGEDCCELHVHGGAAVVNGVLKALSEMEDLRQAQPGEFTQRAFLNGKMDLAEVEGLADLLQAETEAQKMQALAQMEGNLSKLYRGWMDSLKKCLANIEAFIDFSEDQGIDEAILGSAAAQAERLAKEIQDHLSDGRRGERLRSGVKVAIVGRTNVGKSSLFNALCELTHLGIGFRVKYQGVFSSLVQELVASVSALWSKGTKRMHWVKTSSPIQPRIEQTKGRQ
ncbi:unnamed protein product, partial [Ixodes persulcatus]